MHIIFFEYKCIMFSHIPLYFGSIGLCLCIQVNIWFAENIFHFTSKALNQLVYQILYLLHFAI